MKKLGFTLAEVLITLAIIGIVAALTIPTVVHKYQQKAQYTAFMKMYNTLQTALQLSVGENGDYSTWNHSNTEANFKKYLGDYLKVASYCSSDPSKCGITQDLSLKALNSSESYTYISYVEEGDFNTVLTLQDGALLMASIDSEFFQIMADLNGAKGPNTLGRDLFIFVIDATDEGTKILLPGYDNTSEEIISGCTTTAASGGLTCGQRLLLEGKMDY